MDYTLNDEKDFVAWIMTNGESNKDGKLKTEEEIALDGVPRMRTCGERIEFLRKYCHLWEGRRLPEGWTREDRYEIIWYIRNYAITTVDLMRSVVMGEEY